MTSDDTETDSQALRELARWVIRDGVDSDHLEDYMRGLLGNHLIELHASCRYQAMVVTRCFAGLTAQEVAARLRENARELERTRAALRASTRQKLWHQQTNSASETPRVHPIRGRRLELPASREQLSWVPEFIAAVVFTTLGVSMFSWSCSDPVLRLVAASGYSGLGLIYAELAAVCATWHNSHPGGSG